MYTGIVKVLYRNSYRKVLFMLQESTSPLVHKRCAQTGVKSSLRTYVLTTFYLFGQNLWNLNTHEYFWSYSNLIPHTWFIHLSSFWVVFQKFLSAKGWVKMDRDGHIIELLALKSANDDGKLSCHSSLCVVIFMRWIFSWYLESCKTMIVIK